VLTRLQIKDFAIIDAVELELGPGLTALTGETGAGKSILVDALMLALGARAGADVIREGAERADISASFELAGNAQALAWLEAQSVSHDGEVMLRRVVGADGRSRQYINGQPLPAQAVRELGELLVEIHGQQEFLALLKREEQLGLLDEFGQHTELLAPVAAAARHWRESREQLAELASRSQERAARLDLVGYQVEELKALALMPGELEAAIAESSRLAHRGRLSEAAGLALNLSYGAEQADAHALASRAAAALKAVSALDARLEAPLNLLSEAVIGLKEAGRELERYLESLDADPARQEQLARRLAAIEELARKHRVSPGELDDTLARLESELASLTAEGESAESLEARIASYLAEYTTAAGALSRARQLAAKRLAKIVTERMRVLGMPGGQFAVALEPRERDPHPDGAEAVEFQVAANPGQNLRPVARVASGGELSRISLALQVAASGKRRAMGCRVFDEVDAGVGGAVAEMVGRELHALAARSQVLCVTHLPQVASQADHHVRVTKKSDGRRSRTLLDALSQPERVEELARMLAGVAVTDTARKHARAMLEARR
jgi:DNA repair protein RecN (Recombination protein N)